MTLQAHHSYDFGASRISTIRWLMQNRLLAGLILILVVMLAVLCWLAQAWSESRQTAVDTLCDAVIQNDRSTASWLLRAGVPVNVRSRKTLRDIVMGYTAMHCAAQFGSTACVQLLLDHGANPNLKDKMGETPLYMAVTNGHADTILALVKAGADVEAPDHLGNTPLIRAVIEGRVECVSVLLDNGAVVSRTNKAGYTALTAAVLCRAAHNEMVDVIRVLLNAGADPLANDGTGHSAYDLAKSLKYSDLVQMFSALKR